MEEKIKYMFLSLLDELMDLKKFDELFMKQGIKPVSEERNGLFLDISKFFSLKNKLYFEQLSDQDRAQLNNLFSLSLEELLLRKQEVYDFLKRVYPKLMIPDVTDNYVFYGPIVDKYLAPKDAIVLGFNYEEFGIPNDNFDEIYSQREELICDQLNYIQEKIADNIDIKIAVIKYNEFYKIEKKNRIV